MAAWAGVQIVFFWLAGSSRDAYMVCVRFLEPKKQCYHAASLIHGDVSSSLECPESLGFLGLPTPTDLSTTTTISLSHRRTRIYVANALFYRFLRFLYQYITSVVRKRSHIVAIFRMCLSLYFFSVSVLCFAHVYVRSDEEGRLWVDVTLGSRQARG